MFFFSLWLASLYTQPLASTTSLLKGHSAMAQDTSPPRKHPDKVAKTGDGMDWEGKRRVTELGN